MSDLNVVLDDLRLMANDFDQQSEVYRALGATVSPPPADTGDGRVNAVLNSVMDTLTILHEQLATSIQNHAEKLYDARDSYERQDIDNRGLFDNLVEDL